MGPTAGYSALREGAACLDLSGRGKIRVTGDDRVRLLHAMTTNHVERLTPGTGCYAFFLNAQGRILADVHILCFSDHFLLDTEPETRQKVYLHLDKYIIADDVTLEDVTGHVATLAVEGPRSAEMLAAIGAPTPPSPYVTVEWGAAWVTRLSATGANGYRIFLPAEEKSALFKQLEDAGAGVADPNDVRTVRLEHGRPRYGEDIFDSTLPQETQLMHALHFAKGCYLGQEIVERIRSRGHVNRLLVQLHIDGAAVPEPGAKVMVEEGEGGEITSAAASPKLGAVVALAYLRAEGAAGGKPLAVEGAAARILASAPI